LVASEPPDQELDAGIEDGGALDADGEDASEEMDAQEPDAQEPDAGQPDAPPAEASLVAADADCDADFRESNDPAHCGGCDLVCSTEHIEQASCDAGSCDGRCLAGFRDCNADKLRDGCETDLSEPDHCGSCTKVCPFGVCRDYACAEKWHGYFSMKATRLWTFDGMLFVRVALPEGKLLALGVLTQIASSVGMTHLRLGLYYDAQADGQTGMVGQLVASTAQLLVRNTTPGNAENIARGTEGPPIDSFTIEKARNYWIGILPSGPLSVYIEEETPVPLWSWNAPNVAYPGLPGSEPIVPLEAVQGPRIDVYAVVAPVN
jgi:hypothetical protein